MVFDNVFKYIDGYHLWIILYNQSGSYVVKIDLMFNLINIF